MSEPEVALAFTPDPWVEDVHRHLTDHGGARVRSIVVEPSVALDESYDVLVAGHRWPALTHALVADVHARGRLVLGVADREEPASRSHLVALGVDAVVESDSGVDGVTRAIVSIAGRAAHHVALPPASLPTRAGMLLTVGGPPGTGRTEIAIQLARALTRRCSVALVDADDTAPAIAQRLGLALEPNLCAAIDAVEHAQGSLDAALQRDGRAGMPVVAGIASGRAWMQVRPAEVVRVVDGVADTAAIVVVDGAGALEETATGSGRGRYATARALVVEADGLVVVCDASPHGIARLLAWVGEARALAPDVPTIVAANRAPSARFRRAEIYDEVMCTFPVADVIFVPHDPRVADAAWSGEPVGRGPFVRAVDALAQQCAEHMQRLA
jgi:MinD-like ATPase involved in chromosome partitioning or flagellar assembly